jgi:hypothetical protein
MGSYLFAQVARGVASPRVFGRRFGTCGYGSEFCWDDDVEYTQDEDYEYHCTDCGCEINLSDLEN